MKIFIVNEPDIKDKNTDEKPNKMGVQPSQLSAS
jgi:hypothetical protein